ncbi:MAG: preprotein translocase subunit SecY [Candidatus Euphemobacter frigidus]|nr:preprotein translocase subunit SecY [Candidatus Euphemobacter frigidus]MDP8276185.1 preprotein translocase subunit SecY [Candidatus Euphemobacter frigidus]
MLSAFTNIFKIPELRKRIFFTLGLLIVYRIGCYIPTPGIDSEALTKIFAKLTSARGGTIFGLMDIFSGGAISKCTIFALGIMPYISASIIMQLLTAVIPFLEKLSKEGEVGRKKINQYTRYATVVLSLFQGYMISVGLQNPQSIFPGLAQGVQIAPPGLAFRLLAMLTLTSGTIFIMWLGEQITDRGIGNGISLIITTSIISRAPRAAIDAWAVFSPLDPGKATQPLGLLIVMLILFIGVVAAVIMVTQGQRQIPVQYAKRIVGRKIYGGQRTYIPLRVNQAGVIPIIFASALLMFPATLAGFIPKLRALSSYLAPGAPLYSLLYVLLIIFFCYFYTAITFNPVDVADNMRKYGGFIPGIRPGKNTADFLDRVMTRITISGAIFLAAIAILPTLISGRLRLSFTITQFFGGTSLLIIVGVMLDTMRQVESHLLMRHYDGFMKKGKLRGRF